MASTPRAAATVESSRDVSSANAAGNAPTVSPRRTPENVELGSVPNGSAHSRSIPLEEDIMQCARLGEVGLLRKLFESGKFSAQYKDAEGITPLHWAAINNQYAASEFLIKAGADINTRGGESRATPAMWAAQRCHYYLVNLLLQSGTDPLLVDGQGYNILHLATIDGNAFLLVLLLHQEISVDVADPQGHTSLMWAAYKGFPACVDLLLRWGANVNATDEKGLNALHWALVRGSQPCIQKIIDYGVDRFAQTSEGKSPAVVAGEMKSTRMWHRALAECGYDDEGNLKTLPFGLTSFVKDRQVMAKFFFLWPFLTLWVAISILSGMPIYAGLPFSVLISFAMQKFVSYLTQWGPSDYRHIHRTPFVTGVFAGTLFWVGARWLFSILPITFTTHPFFNIGFAASYGLTTYFYFIALLGDPGYVPKSVNRNSQRKVIEELFSLWKFDEQNFCVQCMIRKPLRSKHCWRCGRCVAKHDHHCPWINNCVGNNNLRHFFLYLLFMEIGIIVLIRLVLAYIESLPAPSPSESQCNILSPTLCNLVLRDPWTIIITLWTSLQLVWVTMLIVVQLVQIARNQTTYENMKRHSHLQTPVGDTVTATVVSGSTSLGPEGAGVMGGDGRHGQHGAATRQKGGLFTWWKKLLGLDAFMVTASDASTGGHRRRDNVFSRGVVTNCKDFWLDPAPYFGQRAAGEGMLGGEVINYARMYDTPLRTRSGRGMRYQQVGEDDDGGV